MERTTAAGAIHLALLLGCRKAVLLGLDGRLTDGKRHHHPHAYPWVWPPRSQTTPENVFRVHAAELTSLAPYYAKAGLEVVNASPVTTHKAFPRVKLEDCL